MSWSLELAFIQNNNEWARDQLIFFLRNFSVKSLDLETDWGAEKEGGVEEEGKKKRFFFLLFCICSIRACWDLIGALVCTYFSGLNSYSYWCKRVMFPDWNSKRQHQCERAAVCLITVLLEYYCCELKCLSIKHHNWNISNSTTKIILFGDLKNRIKKNDRDFEIRDRHRKPGECRYLESQFHSHRCRRVKTFRHRIQTNGIIYWRWEASAVCPVTSYTCSLAGSLVLWLSRWLLLRLPDSISMSYGTERSNGGRMYARYADYETPNYILPLLVYALPPSTWRVC